MARWRWCVFGRTQRCELKWLDWLILFLDRCCFVQKNKIKKNPTILRFFCCFLKKYFDNFSTISWSWPHRGIWILSHPDPTRRKLIYANTVTRLTLLARPVSSTWQQSPAISIWPRYVVDGDKPEAFIISDGDKHQSPITFRKKNFF